MQVRAVSASPPQLLHLLGDRFFDGSDAAIVISNSAARSASIRLIGALLLIWSSALGVRELD